MRKNFDEKDLQFQLFPHIIIPVRILCLRGNSNEPKEREGKYDR